MCGVAGIIGHFDKSFGEDLLQKMLSVIQHRGPDSNGFWAQDGFAFGMQRLSIIDIAGGDQPIWSDCGIGIIFNGEIYNFQNLRKDLETEGVKFITHSDTEVILKLYLKKGMEAIHSLEGMFSICLYDPHKKKVFLIRDRLGVKPLYYYQDNEAFIFASEIKAILQVLSHKPEINEQAVWHYLTLRYVPDPNTIWQNILKLPPGHYLEYDLQKKDFRLTKYWSVDFHAPKPQKNRNYEKEFEVLFLEAVEKRLLASDVPVGILLSGGLDSSCVAAAAIELGHKNFHTFSIGFEDGGEFSELQYAQKVSKHIGSIHHEVVLSQNEFTNFLEDFVWYSDEPIADLASIPLYYVSKLAAQHVKVVLSGEGADEVLAGYNLDQWAQKLFYLKSLNWMPSFFKKLLPFQSLHDLARSGYSNFLKFNAAYITNIFSEEEKRELCIFKAQDSTKAYIQSLYGQSSSYEPLEQLQQAYCQSWLVEDLLMKADKMSMANSLELRVPFLDHKLVEWAAQLPLEWKVGSFGKGFTTKRILRSFAQKRLPAAIITRPKQGFPVPAYKWLEKDLFQLAQEKLRSTSLSEWVRRDKIEFLLNKTSQGDQGAIPQVWNLIILAIWLEKWAK